jgi:two-component system response regulator VicR
MTDQANRILLIEDDPALAHTLQEGLVREGYAVTWEAGGTKGLAHARDHQPHLILLDIRLPDLSGFDVCRRMRQMGLRQPVIMLTARGEETDKVLGLEMGADDYITKPFSLRELLARIRAHLRRNYGELAAAEADLLYAGDLVIDLGRAEVRRGDEVVSLTPTEYRLLIYLAHNAGQALSRAQILAAVWGYDADVESERIVTVQIRRLREKVEQNPAHPALILTVPGIGYRLNG